MYFALTGQISQVDIAVSMIVKFPVVIEPSS